MTLDEARSILDVKRGATHAMIREAFRRRARDLHPDRHPDVDATEKKRLAAEFARAREARDILLLVAPASAEELSSPFGSTPDATSRQSSSTYAGARRSPTAETHARPASEGTTSRSRTPGYASATASPPRHTLRFEEFVRQVDALGFGPGIRSRRYVDVAPIVAWSVVGFAVAAVGVGVYLASMAV